MPGLRFAAGEFGIGPRRLGRVAALVEPDPRGLLLTEFSSETESFSTELTGSWLQGEYGMKDLYLGVPCLLGEGGLKKVIEVELSKKEKAALTTSADHVRETVAALKALA